MTDTLFPLTAKYDVNWVKQNSSGENTLYNLESLCEVLDIKGGAHILDLGCGHAISSIFLAREFAANVWAVDKGVSPAENFKRIIEAGCGDRVHPMYVDAWELPFPQAFFDLVVSINAYHLFGTSTDYLPYLTQFIKPGGLIGIVGTCFAREVDSIEEVPDYLKPTYADFWQDIHSIDWWKDLWDKTGLIKVQRAEPLPHNDFILQEFIEDRKNIAEERPIVEALVANTEGFMSLFRMVGERTDKKIELPSR